MTKKISTIRAIRDAAVGGACTLAFTFAIVPAG
jgi:hypothetical protein